MTKDITPGLYMVKHTKSNQIEKANIYRSQEDGTLMAIITSQESKIAFFLPIFLEKWTIIEEIVD